MDLLVTVYSNAIRESIEIKFAYVPASILQKWLLIFSDTFHNLTSDIAFKSAFAVPGPSPLPVTFIKFWQGVENLVESGDFKDALRKWNYKHAKGFRVFRDQILSQSFNNYLDIKSLVMAAKMAKEESPSSFWDQVIYNVRGLFKEQVALELISTMIYAHFATIVKRMGIRYVPKVINYKEKYVKLLQETNECIKILIPNENSSPDFNNNSSEIDNFCVTLDEITDLKSPIDDEMMDNLSHSEQIIQYQSDIKRLTNQIDLLTDNLDNAKSEIASARSEAIKAKEDIFSLKEEAINAKDETALVMQELKISKEECDKLKQQLEAKNGVLEANYSEITQLKNQLEIKSSQLNRAMMDSDKYHKMVIELNSQINEYNDTLDVVNSELKMAKELLDEKTKEIEQYSSEIKELKGKVELSQLNYVDSVKSKELEEKIKNLELINRDFQCEITLLEQEANGWKNAACKLDIEKALLSKQIMENERSVNRMQMCNRASSKRCIGVVPKLAAARSANSAMPKITLSLAETSDSILDIKSNDGNFQRLSTTSTNDIWTYD